jgi:pimeloyl-ACP methyl ester carboxylesterase
MTATVRETNVNTPGGRTLKVLESGDSGGYPIIVHHGTPMSRHLYEGWKEDAGVRGIRLIGYDRPGYGGSDPRPDRRVADAAADTSAIADALGIGRFATWGISGGGPHVLACAALLPDRVSAAASIASIAPWGAEGLDWFAGMGEDNIEEFGLALEGRHAIEPVAKSMAGEMVVADAEQTVEILKTLLSPVDRELLGGELAQYFHAAALEGIRNSTEGWVEDDLAFAMDWGFDLADIDVPVLVMQGREDRFVPFGHGEWLAAHIPDCEAWLTDEDGHLTLAVHGVPRAHAWLLEES